MTSTTLTPAHPGVVQMFTGAYDHLGTHVQGMSTSEALAAAGLSGWNQRLVTPSVVDAGVEYAPGTHRYNVADGPDGPVVLGAVRSTYRPIQNEEAFTPLLDGFAEAGLVPSTMGHSRNLALSFVVFDLPEGVVGVHGDPVLTRLLVAKKNDGSGAVSARPIGERVFCRNQIAGLMARSAPVVKVRHTSGADPYVVQAAERLYGITQDWGAALAEWAEDLTTIPVSTPAFASAVESAVLGERPTDEGRSQTIWDRKFSEIMDAWHSPTMNMLEYDAWRAYNAVTEFEQHRRSGSADVRAAATVKTPATAASKVLELLGAEA